MQYPHKERTMTRDGCKQPRDTKWPQNSHKDKQKFHKVQLFCVSFSPGVYRMSRGPCTCLRIRKNRFTFIISGLIVCGWNNMTSYLFTCCPPAFCRLAWLNLWHLRGSAECIVEVLVQPPQAPPTPDLRTHRASHAHLVFRTVPWDPSTDWLTAQRVLRASEGPRCSFRASGRVESILVNIHQTETANPWSNVTQVLNLAQPCWWWTLC